MANTNITIRIDEKLKSDLQELVTKLGMDMTTFFVMTAKQAIRDQALPFQPSLNTGIYSEKVYEFAKNNTKYNNEGRAVISKDDEWLDETEWDDLYEQMKKEREHIK